MYSSRICPLLFHSSIQRRLKGSHNQNYWCVSRCDPLLEWAFFAVRPSLLKFMLLICRIILKVARKHHPPYSKVKANTELFWEKNRVNMPWMPNWERLFKELSKYCMWSFFSHCKVLARVLGNCCLWPYISNDVLTVRLTSDMKIAFYNQQPVCFT